MLSVGRKVEAIKAYQEETGAGLKEAKRRVESFGA
ncbi:MAG: ribosomal protein L7/L12 [Solirubrobacterales bacterium]